MRRSPIIAGLAALLFAGAGAWIGRESLMLSYLGAKTIKRDLAEQQAFLAPYIHVYAPASGAPPFPTLVQFHGCAGYREGFMAQWARVANEAGWLVVGVDSNGARGLDREQSLSSVCAGKTLLGQERAGDIAATLAMVAAREDVDPAKIVAAGWSHGAWSLMDYVALSSSGRSPPSLKSAPPAVDLAGIILFYPYCGVGAWSRLLRWEFDAPALAFVAGKDTIVDGAECKVRLEKIARAGAGVDLVWYKDADHVFDDKGLLGGEHAHYYSAGEAEDSARRYSAFLTDIMNRP